MSANTPSRAEEIAQIREDYPGMYRVALSIFFIIFGIVIGPTIIGWLNSTPDGYETNIYTEILSVAGTILILNYLQERREDHRREKDLQGQLVREAGSSVNTTARSAIDTMRKRGWLYGEGFLGHSDSILQGKIISAANLEEANLGYADLRNTNLHNTNLTKADLMATNLAGASLGLANLSNAKLFNANLTGADFFNTNLENANLTNADLSNSNLMDANLLGANLRGANLQNALISTTIIETSTILPDGSRWSPERKLSEFGAETRREVDYLPSYNADGINIILFTFSGGTECRWQRGKGWLDDKDGTPIAYLDGLYDKANKRWIIIYTYPDGTKRRWTYSTGWLDDANGNPING